MNAKRGKFQGPNKKGASKRIPARMMGQGNSRKAKFEPTGPCILHETLHDSILSELLLFVDSKTLLNSGARVCRKWQDLIGNNNFWLEKCIQGGISLPPPRLRSHQQFDYARIAVMRPFGRNLIKNPSGEESFKFWSIIEQGGNQWMVQKPPHGSDATGLDEGVEVPIESCFATSYSRCSKVQTVDLEKEGIQGRVLDELTPVITVSEWHAARFDCGAKYQFRVELLDKDPGDVEKDSPYNSMRMGDSDSDSDDDQEFGRKSPRDPHFFNKDRKATVKGIHRDEIITGQWEGKEWKKWTHQFSDYPPGVRFVRFWHCGVDTQFWAGHYGPKMSKASVIVSFL